MFVVIQASYLLFYLNTDPVFVLSSFQLYFCENSLIIQILQRLNLKIIATENQYRIQTTEKL